MTKYYTRACNFKYGSIARKLIKNKSALPLCGDKNISFSEIELINEIQEILPQDKKKIYSIYKEFIPKNTKWNKYIKSNIKQQKKELLEYLSRYWECSQNEVREYLNFLGDDEILRILGRMGIQQKEINKLLWN